MRQNTTDNINVFDISNNSRNLSQGIGQDFPPKGTENQDPGDKTTFSEGPTTTISTILLNINSSSTIINTNPELLQTNTPPAAAKSPIEINSEVPEELITTNDKSISECPICTDIFDQMDQIFLEHPPNEKET